MDNPSTGLILNLYVALPNESQFEYGSSVNNYITFDFADKVYLEFYYGLNGSCAILRTTLSESEANSLPYTELIGLITLYKNECQVHQIHKRFYSSSLKFGFLISNLDGKYKNLFKSTDYSVRIQLLCDTDKADIIQLYTNLFKLKDELLNQEV